MTFIAGDHTIEIVAELKRQQSLGRIRYYGVSNFGVQDLKRFLAAGAQPISNQVPTNSVADSVAHS